MVCIEEISNECYIKYKDIFRIADGLFGWTKDDAYKVLLNDQEFILFYYYPMYMLFGYGMNREIINKSFVVDDNNKIVSFTIDGYQVNIDKNSVYLINENGYHQSVQIMKNEDNPMFDTISNGLLLYMQYDSKQNVRLIINYDYNVFNDKRFLYVDYLKEPFCYTFESNPIKRDKGLKFLGRKDSYYRLDFDVWNNKWQYDLSTIGEYGIDVVMSSDTITLHGGNKEFFRYYKVLFSVTDYFSLTTFPFGKAYKSRDMELLINNMGFNSSIPNFVVEIFNNKEMLVKNFQDVVDSIVYFQNNNFLKK